MNFMLNCKIRVFIYKKHWNAFGRIPLGSEWRLQCKTDRETKLNKFGKKEFLLSNSLPPQKTKQLQLFCNFFCLRNEWWWSSSLLDRHIDYDENTVMKCFCILNVPPQKKQQRNKQKTLQCYSYDYIWTWPLGQKVNIWPLLFC